MDNLKIIWESTKGKIAVTSLTFILGLSAVATTVGVELVDGPDGAVCIAASKDTVVAE